MSTTNRKMAVHFAPPFFLFYSRRLTLRLFVIKNNLVDNKEHHHRHTAVQNGSTDVIKPRINEVTCNSRPNAIDRINNAGDNAECQKIPRALTKYISV